MYVQCHVQGHQAQAALPQAFQSLNGAIMILGPKPTRVARPTPTACWDVEIQTTAGDRWMEKVNVRRYTDAGYGQVVSVDQGNYSVRMTPATAKNVADALHAAAVWEDG
jgi:hypothetical protein